MLSLPHLIVIFIVALVIFGPEKLPELARILGKATSEFRRMTTDFRFALEREVRDLDREVRMHEEERKTAESQIPPNWPMGTQPREIAPDEAKPPGEPVGQEDRARVGAGAGEPAPPVGPETKPNTTAPPHEKSPEDHAA